VVAVERPGVVIQSVYHQCANPEDLSGRERAFHRVGQHPCTEPVALCRAVNGKPCEQALLRIARGGRHGSRERCAHRVEVA
jgi:hypothetical protein